jgi:hypothetical protein
MLKGRLFTHFLTRNFLGFLSCSQRYMGIMKTAWTILQSLLSSRFHLGGTALMS